MVYKELNLKDGRMVNLNWLNVKDLPGVVEALNSVIREGKYLSLNKEITDMEEEQRWFEESTRAGMLYLVARVDGNVVAGASIRPFLDKRTHVAGYGIFIRDGYRNVGLGTILTRIFIEIAKKHRFEILQLSVFATNKRAHHVYRKCGYKECGKLTRDIKFLNGTYSDRILMELLLR